MKCKLIIGIDVSKRTLDMHIKPVGATLQITNDLAGFMVLKKQVTPGSEVLVVMEHTGLYSRKLELFLHSHRIAFCKVPALEIKRSLGVVRGKNDRIDASRIAEYAWLRRDQLIPTLIIPEDMEQLNHLLSMRAKLVKDRSGYLSRLKELKSSTSGSVERLLLKSHRTVIEMLTKQIGVMESGILTVIQGNEEYQKTFLLLTSMKGVGKIVAAKMIAATNNFTKFSNARKFNCYAGLAPFKHESGTSIRGRARVSHLANKDIKTMLNLSAFCAVRFDAELKQYYQKRVAEGKPKMACINIIRSKIVARMFAIIKRQQPYQLIPVAA
jgi:transposase